MLPQLIQDFQAPLQQLVNLNLPVLSQQHIQIIQKIANNPYELNKLVQELQYQYIHDAKPVYLGVLYFFSDYLGVGIITNTAFQTFCKNINQIPFNEPSAKIAILLSELVFTKLSPLDEDGSSPELQEVFIMNSRAVMVQNMGAHNIQMKQQLFDCFYVSQVLISKELLRQLFQLQAEGEDQNNQIVGGEDTKLNFKLRNLHLKANQHFKLVTIPASLPKNSSDEQKDERKLVLYTILKENEMELQQFLAQNILTNLVCDLLIEQGVILKDIKSQLIDLNPQLKDEFSLQKLEFKSKFIKKPQTIQQSIPLNQRTSFNLYEQIVQDEDQTHEFKRFYWPINDAKKQEIILQVICSFLNTKGGYLFIGIKDQNKEVYGMQLSAKQRDELKLLILSLGEKIQPRIDMVQNPTILVSFLPIKNKNGLNQAGNFVVRIIVQRGDPDRFYVYQNQQTQLIEGQVRMDGRKKTYIYPEVLEMAYKICKNPHDKIAPLLNTQPDPITDVFTQKESQVEGNYVHGIQRPQRFSSSRIDKPRRDMSIEEQVEQTTHQNQNNNFQQNRIVSEDQRSFKVILYWDMPQDQIKLIANQILGEFANKIQSLEIKIYQISHNEFDIILSNMNLVHSLHGRLMKQTQTLKNLQVIRAIKFQQKMLFDFTPELLENVKKQIQPELLVFGFIKMDYTQKLNLLSSVNQMIQEMHIQTSFVHQYENSILIGFTGQNYLDNFVYGVLSQQQLFKRYGYQQNLMGGKVSKKITYKGISPEIVQSLQNAFSIEVGTNQDGSGYLVSRNEEDAAKIFDFLLIQKNKLKKNSGPNKLEVLWQLETLLVNIK